MSRICPSCGNDAMFDVARCPACGADMAGGPPPSPARPSAPAGSEWEKTVVESSVPRSSESRRPRFDRGREFYESIEEIGRGQQGGSGEAADADATVVERQRPPEPEDATIIIRSGRRGVSGPLAYLIERNGIRAGKVHLLRKETSVGRGPDNDVVLGDDTVSKHHAKVRLEDGAFVFWDLASTNFSHLIGADGARTRILEPHRLADGDTLDLGDARVSFILVDDAGMAGDVA
jgi:hypothetical protein